MKTILTSMLLATFLSGNSVQAAQSEWEPNNNPVEANANAFSKLDIKDEIVGQLYGGDSDVYYLDVAPGANLPNVPVYFGCNLRLADAIGGTCPNGNPPSDAGHWSVNYFYSANGTGDDAVLQSAYFVDPLACKQGSADIKGPFRFQMNTAFPGRYYVAISGVFRQCQGFSSTENSGDSTVVGVSPTADYALRAFTGRIAGVPEPNDGQVEATSIKNKKALTGQFASMYDRDFYKYHVAKGNGKPTQVYFSCKGAHSGAYFLLSWYDPNGVLQSTYEVTAPECQAKKYNFEIVTPVAGDYYLVVTPPTYLGGSTGVGGPSDSSTADTPNPGSKDTANRTQFSSHDYVLKLVPGKKKSSSGTSSTNTPTTGVATEKCSGISCLNQPF